MAPLATPSTAASLVPERASLAALRRAAASCTACPLWKRGTQTVFGDGSTHARVVLVGEQPGNEEDLAGKPFVGPAGRLLERALDEAGLDRRLAYLTNVVKHFKWEPKGKLRIHSKPNAREIGACLPWLEAELAAIRPEVVVCLGATAARALIGPGFRVTRDRGTWVESPLAPRVTGTVHPSSILRAPDSETRRGEMRRFVGDLRKVARALRA